MKAVYILLFAALLVAGCGQKGPLYLPGEAPESQTQGPFGLDADQTSGQDAAEDTDSGGDDNMNTPPVSGSDNSSP